MDFKFVDIPEKELFMLICNSIVTEEYYIRNKYSVTKTVSDFGKISLIIQLDDLDINVYISNVFEENDKYIIDNESGCKIVVTVKKIDLEFGNVLLKNHYHYRQVCNFGETTAYELTKFLVDLIEKHEPRSRYVSRTFTKLKTEHKKCMDDEIRRHARSLKINMIL